MEGQSRVEGEMREEYEVRRQWETLWRAQEGVKEKAESGAEKREERSARTSFWIM